MKFQRFMRLGNDNLLLISVEYFKSIEYGIIGKGNFYAGNFTWLYRSASKVPDITYSHNQLTSENCCHQALRICYFFADITTAIFDRKLACPPNFCFAFGMLHPCAECWGLFSSIDHLACLVWAKDKFL